ncbi:MAG: hypothetical protein ACREPM_08210 [Gemmatimonadaceae bacterium]
MAASPAALRFPFTRVLLPRTRLAYIHLHNLLTDAKRDRAARISGYVAISLLEELVVLYLVGDEVANATVRDARGSRAIAIPSALEKVPAEPEYGEICFHEADQEQLSCMFAAQSAPAVPWPEPFTPSDPAVLFPHLMSLTFDGVVEIIANDAVNYLIFKHGTVARTFLASAHHGTIVDRVAKLFAREGRVGDLRVARWDSPAPLPIQAPPGLVQAYRDLAAALVQKLVENGRDSAPTIAEHARQNLLPSHPVLESFAVSGRPNKEPLADTAGLTSGVAAWIKEVMWAAVDHDATSPEQLLRDLTWDRRHVFQSAGLYEQIPWKVM